MVLLLVFMQLTRDLFAMAKFLLTYAPDEQTNKQTDGAEHSTHADRLCQRGLWLLISSHCLLLLMHSFLRPTGRATLPLK